MAEATAKAAKEPITRGSGKKVRALIALSKAVSYLTLMPRKPASSARGAPDPGAAQAFSRVSVKSQTVIPRAVRERLGVKAGDRLRYRLTERGIVLDKAPSLETDDPFAMFSEWASEADEKAYGDL